MPSDQNVNEITLFMQAVTSHQHKVSSQVLLTVEGWARSRLLTCSGLRGILAGTQVSIKPVTFEVQYSALQQFNTTSSFLVPMETVHGQVVGFIRVRIRIVLGWLLDNSQIHQLADCQLAD